MTAECSGRERERLLDGYVFASKGKDNDMSDSDLLNLLC